ncbi:Gldg family protein, partial [bacterium]|nr:Gldg family protein [bacterium]
MKNNRKQFTTTFIIGAVLLASIIVLVNMIFDNLNFGRFDFTSGRIYSISDASENILESLEAPITLTYYVSSSEKMPTKWKNLERDVIDILKELKLASKGKLDYTVFDPTVEEEKEAVAAELA